LCQIAGNAFFLPYTTDVGEACLPIYRQKFLRVAGVKTQEIPFFLIFKSCNGARLPANFHINHEQNGIMRR
jgi:hypothetical protein